MCECTICYEIRSYDDEVILPCLHRLCVICYESILNTKPSCPYCRYEIEPPTVTPQDDQIDPYSLWIADRLIVSIVSFIWGIMFIYGIPIR